MTANPNLPTDTIILGDEYDDALRTALWRVLLDMDVELIDRTWGVGGSQEVETARIRIGEDLLTVESETYMGLSLQGPKPVIERIAVAVHALLGDSQSSRKNAAGT